MKITLHNTPDTYGGALVEAGHTALLWRRAGHEVTVAMVNPPRPDNPWLSRLVNAGCRIVQTDADIKNTVVVSFCSHFAVEAWPRLREAGCRFIWSPAMTYLTKPEMAVFPSCPPTVVHFQSQHQASKLWPYYSAWGVEHKAMIRGAFEVGDFPFQPAERRRQFVVGRLARPDATKWPSDLWSILEGVRRHGIDLRAVCMGWSAELTRKCGTPPKWAECYLPGAISTRTFLAKCHALLCINGGDEENWPRVGLEAMAAGVPLVVENKWGWREMCNDQTALMVDDHRAATEALISLASNDLRRMELARGARESLYDQETVIEGWNTLLEKITL